MPKLTEALTIGASVADPLPQQLVVRDTAEAAAVSWLINGSGCQGVDVLIDGHVVYDFDIYPRDCADDEALHTRFRMTQGSRLVGGIRAWCDDLVEPHRAVCGCVSVEGLVIESPSGSDGIDASGSACVVALGNELTVPREAPRATNALTGHERSRTLGIGNVVRSTTAENASALAFIQDARATLLGGSVDREGWSRAVAVHVGGWNGGRARAQVFGAQLSATRSCIDIKPGEGGRTVVAYGDVDFASCALRADVELAAGEELDLTHHALGETVALEVAWPTWLIGQRETGLKLR